MHAIIKTGGKQYLVTTGDVLQIEKLAGEKGDSITFDTVLLTADDKTYQLGKPTVSGATVTATILKQGRGRKIHVLKYKAKSKYRRKIGHRQAYTEIKIEQVK